MLVAVLANVSAAAATCGENACGLDFSTETIGIAQGTFRGIEFQESDAQSLLFVNATFDRVLANFTLLHLSDPERACAEACRVLKPPGKFGFTVWAAPAENPCAKLIEDVLRKQANMELDLPTGPHHHLFSFVALPKATDLLFPRQRTTSRRAKKQKIAKEEEKTQRAAA